MPKQRELVLLLGVYDDPEKQEQKEYTVDLYRSNVAIFGGTMSGKTTLLKTLLVRLHQVAGNTDKENVFILDFSNNLKKYSKLPYVIAYFDATNGENVRRVFKLLDEALSKNTRELKGDLFVDSLEGSQTHVTLVIDGLNSFFAEDRYSKYQEKLLKLAREVAKGISVVFTANESSGGVGRLLSAFNRIIAFDLPKDKYADVFTAKVDKPMIMPGRGIVNIDATTYEFQAFLPYNADEKDEYQEITDIMAYLVGKGVDTAKWKSKKHKRFEGELTETSWKECTEEPFSDATGVFTAGLDYYSFEPIRLDLERAQAIAIYGSKNSGKSNLLRLILDAACKIPNVRLVFLEDGRHGLSDVKPIPTGIDVREMTTIKDFVAYIIREGYYDVPDDIRPIFFDEMSATVSAFRKKANPFTIFVVQSRLFYQTSIGGDSIQVISRLAPFISNSNEEDGESYNKVLFIFYDVQRIQNDEARLFFNNSIAYAFLLDDILRFVDDKGKQSVFGSRDRAELKDEFDLCDKGDGFFFDLAADHLTKLKFIKSKGGV